MSIKTLKIGPINEHCENHLLLEYKNSIKCFRTNFYSISLNQLQKKLSGAYNKHISYNNKFICKNLLKIPEQRLFRQILSYPIHLWFLIRHFYDTLYIKYRLHSQLQREAELFVTIFFGYPTSEPFQYMGSPFINSVIHR